MKVAILSPVAWRTPPRHYGPWERFVFLLSEGLIARGVDVTVFASGNSFTSGKLEWICPAPYEEDPALDAKVCEALHIGHFFEQAPNFDLLHNNFDFLPLAFSGLIDRPLLTTIHGFSSPKILPVYEKYNDRSYYISISNADRNPRLRYLSTVYHGIDLKELTWQEEPGDYLLYFGRIHPDKGTAAAIAIARAAKMPLKIAGIIQDQDYFNNEVLPCIDNEQFIYLGPVGPEERDPLLGGAYALLHPIYFDEPFGLSVVEAMACGTPVIAFDRGSMPEMIAEGKTGFLVREIAGAVECLTEIPRLDRWDCRHWVEEHFSQDIMVKNYLDLYQFILNKGPVI